MSLSKKIPFPVYDTGSPMIVRLDHLTFVARQTQFLTPFPWISVNRIEALGFELFCSSEQVRVVGHVKQRRILHPLAANMTETSGSL